MEGSEGKAVTSSSNRMQAFSAPPAYSEVNYKVDKLWNSLILIGLKPVHSNLLILKIKTLWKLSWKNNLMSKEVFNNLTPPTESFIISYSEWAVILLCSRIDKMLSPLHLIITIIHLSILL